MDASVDHHSPFNLDRQGRFSRAFVQTVAGEIEVRLSHTGNWQLRVRRGEEASWRLACAGDLDFGSLTTQPIPSLADETLRLGPLTVEPAARRTTVGEVDVCLSNKEFALLVVLASQPDRVFTKAELLKMIWGYPADARTRTLDSHASRVRCKLRKAGVETYVVNCWGIGYRLWDRPVMAQLGPVAEAA